jgi:hypothetical protein
MKRDPSARAHLKAVPSLANRRRGPRQPVDGPAHIVLPDGRLLDVTLRNLSSNGALISHPTFEPMYVGHQVILAGSRMIWERRARVVALTEDGVHVAFE